MSDERIRKSVGADKAERAEEDRTVTQNREWTEAERLELLRASTQQAVLPNLPEISGYHVCWLSTKNAMDSIVRRQQLGYELIKASDIPAFSSMKITNGEFEGCVGVNEMIAAKIPEDIYQFNMRFFHSMRPREEEDRMNSARDAIREEAAKRNLRVAEDEEVETWK